MTFKSLLRKFVIIFVVLVFLLPLTSCSYILYQFDQFKEDFYEEQEEEPTLPSSVPSWAVNHSYLSERSQGTCKVLAGNVTLLVIFVDDPESNWTEEEINTYKTYLSELTPKIVSDSVSYGAELSIEVQYTKSVSKVALDREDRAPWINSAVSYLEYPTDDTLYDNLKSAYNTDELPVLFIKNTEGRSFASSLSGENGLEYAIIFDDMTAIYHELSHIFGAVDYYYPDAVARCANKHLANSIMLDSTNDFIDSFTAFLVGWTDDLSEEALSFLSETSYLTEDMLSDAHDYDIYTGNVTDRVFENGTYTGYLDYGVFNGKGIFVYNNGDKFDGEWVNGSINGYGVYTWANGSVYEGNWVNDNCEGYGKMTYFSGNVYEGNWKNGLRDGEGTYTTAESTYTGNWSEDKMNGYGVYTWSVGDKFEGNWLNGEIDGYGTYTWSNGDSFAGDWVNGNRTGTGTYTWSNGDYYTGDWVDNQRHGNGKLIFANGSSYQGRWDNDKYIG